MSTRANFWVIEGVAMFMESLRKEGSFYELGGFDDARMQAAQVRLLNDNFYVPLDEFCGYNSERLQSDPRVARLYSQSAGLTYFLIFYHDGRYRDALVNYLVRIYSGRDDLGTFGPLDRRELPAIGPRISRVHAVRAAGPERRKAAVGYCRFEGSFRSDSV